MRHIAFVLVLSICLIMSCCTKITENTQTAKVNELKEDVTSTAENTNDTAKITSNETEINMIRKSMDDKDYSSAGKIDFTLKGYSNKETLYITKEKSNSSNTTNNPTKLTLKILNNQIEYESIWNDGIKVSLTDFDSSDDVVDIYITELGTDIGSRTTLYKFDGTKLYEYDKIKHFGGALLYDGKGNIYYWLNDGSKKEINKAYNYKSKVSEDITDTNLKIKLSEVR